MSAKKLTNVRLSEGERAQMKRLAARLGLSESRTVARALEVLQVYLDTLPPERFIITGGSPGGIMRKGDVITIGNKPKSTTLHMTGDASSPDRYTVACVTKGTDDHGFRIGDEIRITPPRKPKGTK